MLPYELVHEILDYCGIGDLIRLGCTSRSHATLARDYLQLRMHHNICRFCTDVYAFQKMLRSCHSVVSGSAALHILLPAKTMTWVPADLDIYVAFGNFHRLMTMLQDQNYHLIHQGSTNLNSYSFSCIRTVATFTNSLQQIHVVVSKMAASISPILQFHSTAVMNFFGVDDIFSAYPALTLQMLSKINPARLYFGRFRHATISALWKYAERGFRYTSCESGHQSKYTCKSIVRNLTDAGCMWIDLKGLPHVSTTSLTLFKRYGFMDVEWVLGGMVCGSQSAFLDAHMHVVQDQSCVTLLQSTRISD